jgi:hypothetical protein
MDLDYSKLIMESNEYRPPILLERSVSFLKNEDETGYDFAMTRTLRFILIHTAFLGNIFRGIFVRSKRILLSSTSQKHYQFQPQTIPNSIFEFQRAISQYHLWNSLVIREMAILPGRYQYFWTLLWNTYYKSSFNLTHHFHTKYPYVRLYQNASLNHAIKDIYSKFHEPIADDFTESSESSESSCSKQLIALLHREMESHQTGLESHVGKKSMEITGSIFQTTIPWLKDMVYYKSVDDTISLYYFPKILGVFTEQKQYLESVILPILHIGLESLGDALLIPLTTKSLFLIDIQYIQLLSEYNMVFQKDYNAVFLHDSTHTFLSRTYYNPPDDPFKSLKSRMSEPLKPPGIDV